MSYSLLDVDKGRPIMHLASVGGMKEMLDFVRGLKTVGPLNNFLNQGSTDNVKGVISDITQYAPMCSVANVKTTLLHLKEGLEQIQGSAMIVD
jgi:hypothetical protein